MSWYGLKIAPKWCSVYKFIGFELVSSDTSQRYSLPPMTIVSQLMAHHEIMVEIVACMDDEV
jgi:hypothetical protein